MIMKNCQPPMPGREDKIKILKTVAETVASFVSAGKATSAGQQGFPALMGFLPKLTPLWDDL
jgi:hypothetical protein